MRNTVLEWLALYKRRKADVKAVEALYKQLAYVNSGGRRYTREDRSER